MAKSEDKTEPKTTKAAPRKTASAKSATAKKPAAAKSASKAAASNSDTARSSAPLKSAAPRPLSDEERYKMTEVAAYFLAERNNFSGNPVEYWRAAEVQISNMLSMQ
ncbi:MAG TPA: DUF2934 domain-containing protein [Methylophilaceae bacterium]|nr:DUF2934 domain-containing protein [Methylophilaceae bacterium]